jgi:acyl-CoA thioester hydrolase
VRPRPAERTTFAHFLTIATRWSDNDIYGHLNNVVYYAYFDTAVNRYLIEAGALDIERGPVIGLVVETGCNYFEPLAFPETLDTGIRVEHLGTSSVRYRIGIFRAGDPLAAAQGHFVHVYVDRKSRRPTPIPSPMRTALERLILPDLRS